MCALKHLSYQPQKLTTKYLRGCPSTDWWISVTSCCFCHQCDRCDSSGISMLTEESLSLEISLQVSCVSSTEKYTIYFLRTSWNHGPKGREG